MHLFIIHFAHDISETFCLPSVSFYFSFDTETFLCNNQSQGNKKLKVMFVKHKIFGFYVIISLSFMTNKVRGETDLSSLIKDHNTVDTDMCYSFLKENPCAQNVLKILINEIDNMKDQINYNGYQIKDLKDQNNFRENQIKELTHQINSFAEKSQKKEEKLILLQNKLERKQQQVDSLEDRLQDSFVGYEKVRVNSEKSKYNPHFKIPNSSLQSFLNGSNTSYGTLKNGASREIDSWSLVRQSS